MEFLSVDSVSDGEPYDFACSVLVLYTSNAFWLRLFLRSVNQCIFEAKEFYHREINDPLNLKIIVCGEYPQFVPSEN